MFSLVGFHVFPFSPAWGVLSVLPPSVVNKPVAPLKRGRHFGLQFLGWCPPVLGLVAHTLRFNSVPLPRVGMGRPLASSWVGRPPIFGMVCPQFLGCSCPPVFGLVAHTLCLRSVPLPCASMGRPLASSWVGRPPFRVSCFPSQGFMFSLFAVARWSHSSHAT